MIDCGAESLERFVQAQEPLIDEVRRELAAGRKRSHWMWFIFPQIRGLGNSYTARFYAIASLDEAQAYLRHPILGPRLTECTALVNAIDGQDINEIFGYPDNLKFCSSMSLFAEAAARASMPSEEAVFRVAIDRYFGGKADLRTLELLQRRTQ